MALFSSVGLRGRLAVDDVVAGRPREAQPAFLDERDPRDVVEHEARIRGALLVQRQILPHGRLYHQRAGHRRKSAAGAEVAWPVPAGRGRARRRVLERPPRADWRRDARAALAARSGQLAAFSNRSRELVVRFHDIGGVIDLPLEKHRAHIGETTRSSGCWYLSSYFRSILNLLLARVTVTALAGRSRGVISPLKASRVAVPPSLPPGSVSLRSLVRKRAAILRTGGTRSPGFVPG